MSTREVVSHGELKLRLLLLEDFIREAKGPVALCYVEKTIPPGIRVGYARATARWARDPGIVVYYEEEVYNMLGPGRDEENRRKAQERLDEIKALLAKHFTVLMGQWEV